MNIHNSRSVHCEEGCDGGLINNVRLLGEEVVSQYSVLNNVTRVDVRETDKQRKPNKVRDPNDVKSTCLRKVVSTTVETHE